MLPLPIIIVTPCEDVEGFGEFESEEEEEKEESSEDDGYSFPSSYDEDDDDDNLNRNIANNKQYLDVKSRRY